MNESVVSAPRALLAEFLGTLLLLAIVVGSGIMGERLAEGSAAVALLAFACAARLGRCGAGGCARGGSCTSALPSG